MAKQGKKFLAAAALVEKGKTYTITEIGDSAFSPKAGMGNPVPEITSIVMPNSITYIGGSAFELCSKLTSVVLPESLTHIGSYAFYNCDNLTNITFPDNLEKIGEGAQNSFIVKIADSEIDVFSEDILNQ